MAMPIHDQMCTFQTENEIITAGNSSVYKNFNQTK